MKRKSFKFSLQYLLVFICGFLMAFQIYFYQENIYERQLFSSLSRHVRLMADSSSRGSRDERYFIAATELTHDLVQNRMNRFDGIARQSGFKLLLQPVSFDLMTGNGACGSNSYVLSRLLMELGYEVRIAQMGSGKVYGRHIVTEVWNGSKWVVLDALYDLSFRDSSGNLASFKEISQNWKYYKAQTPTSYDRSYDYEAVRYTNWNKIPVIFPVIKKILDWTIGSAKADNICLRRYYIRKYQVLLKINFVLIGLCAYLTYKQFRIKKLNTQ